MRWRTSASPLSTARSWISRKSNTRSTSSSPAKSEAEPVAALELASVVGVAGFPARHGFSTRALGSMGLTSSTDPDLVMQRRQRLADQLGFDLARALMTVQEHGANVVTFHRRRPEGGQCVFDTDALATDVPGQAIVTYHADCFPLLFFDASRGVVAGAHAGGRGSLAGGGRPRRWRRPPPRTAPSPRSSMC